MGTTKQQHLDYFEQGLEDMLSIAKAKNADYTAGTGDPFANFRHCEKLGIATVEAGILVRMTDKMARLVTLITGHKLRVMDEKLGDTLLDLANYALILRSYIYHEGCEKPTAVGETTPWTYQPGKGYHPEEAEPLTAVKGSSRD